MTKAHLTSSTDVYNLTSLSGLQGVQALTQQVLRLYGVGFAIILGIQSAHLCCFDCGHFIAADGNRLLCHDCSMR